ncbi:ABC transporter permease (plasmid) [Mesorhizobium sp. AR07]|uniref:ABC transporter permease n=1 Tax=Mesorhizobium sp. AR07 TaxID=2865838 RepID=UPI002160B512|nr:ABC transporter permease [Mesorhizobium sp. AR07]UVK48667.1 ABC transporter permease [Mesorhizobium sp. AR07]
MGETVIVKRIRFALIALVALYLIGPTLVVIWLSFSKDEVLRFPPHLFSWRWYEEFLFDERWNDAVLRSLLVGSLATLFATLIGSVAAFGIARTRLPGKQIVEIFAIAPLVVPPIILATGGYSLYSNLNMIGSNIGLAIMHTVLGVPYVYLIVSSALTRNDPSIELAALSLGANRWRTIRDVTVPANLPAIITGALFAFLISFDEVVVTVFLSGSMTPTLPVRVFSSLSLAVSPVVAAVSTAQIIIALILMSLLGQLQRWQRRWSEVTPAL